MRVTCDYVNGVENRQVVTLEMDADEALVVAQACDAATKLAYLAAEHRLDRAVEVQSLLADTARDLRNAASMLP